LSATVNEVHACSTLSGVFAHTCASFGNALFSATTTRPGADTPAAVRKRRQANPGAIVSSSRIVIGL
jgi:hypothetical protein